VRMLDSSITASRPLRFFGYAIAVPRGVKLGVERQSELLDQLTAWGIPVAPHRLCCASLEEVHEWARALESRVRATLDFAIDGGVVKVDRLALWEELGIDCPNVACPGRQLEGLVHFASRGAMDIRGLSYARIEQLIQAGFIHDVGDLYSVTEEQLLQLDGFAEKSAQQLVAAIAASKKQPLSRLLFGLGIRHVGSTAAELLARHFGDLPAISEASADDILAIRGIGEIIAVAVTSFFADPSARKLVKKLAAAGVNFTEPKP